MPGGEICVPTHLNSMKIREEIHQRIAEGWYLIGEPCVESVLVRYKAEDGSVKREITMLDGYQFSKFESVF